MSFENVIIRIGFVCWPPELSLMVQDLFVNIVYVLCAVCICFVYKTIRCGCFGVGFSVVVGVFFDYYSASER